MGRPLPGSAEPAKSRQARPEEAQEPTPGTAKGAAFTILSHLFGAGRSNSSEPWYPGMSPATMGREASGSREREVPKETPAGFARPESKGVDS